MQLHNYTQRRKQMMSTKKIVASTLLALTVISVSLSAAQKADARYCLDCCSTGKKTCQ